MGAKSREPKNVLTRLPVNQKQVRFDVTFSVARPIAAQFMVAVPGLKRLICDYRLQNGAQRAIERHPMLTFGFTFVIALKC